MSRFTFGAAVVLMVGVPVLVASARTQEVSFAGEAAAHRSVRPQFRSTTTIVTLNVTVTDRDRPVKGLSTRDFQLYEDGVPQPVELFDAAQVPLDVILLVDTSSSMRDDMPLVHKAARQFMEVLRPQDRGAVVTFSDRINVVQELTSDRRAIEAAIDSAAGDGATALHDALYVTLKHFGRTAVTAGEVRRQAIAVLSDGEDTRSLISFDDVLMHARTTGVNVYAISLGSGSEGGDLAAPGSAADRLQTLAKETGASIFFPSNARELVDVYTSIARELRAQYSLAYAAPGGVADRRFRRIQVRLPRHPEFRVRARTGYVADVMRPRR